MGYMAQSLKARRYICEGMSTCTPIDVMPLWHSAMFQKGGHLTYYCPALVKLGILTVGDLYNSAGAPNPSLLRKMGPTWVPPCSQGLGWIQGTPQFDRSIPSMRMGAWGKSDMLKLQHRQYSETRKVLWRTRLPPFLHGFFFCGPVAQAESGGASSELDT